MLLRWGTTAFGGEEQIQWCTAEREHRDIVSVLRHERGRPGVTTTVLHQVHGFDITRTKRLAACGAFSVPRPQVLVHALAAEQVVALCNYPVFQALL